MSHTSVLLQESIEGLEIRAGDVFVDATFGDGGHSRKILETFGDRIIMVGIDRDGDAIVRGRDIPEITRSKKVFLKQGNFRDIPTILESLGLKDAQRFLFDLGLNSRQIAESGRGFSFQKNEPLVMTYEKIGEPADNDDSSGEPADNDDSPGEPSESGATRITAKDVVNDWEENNLFEIIKGFGEERFARKIARGIAETRKKKTIATTNDLVEIIMKSTPTFYHRQKIHPATRTFQAIRIAVNDELGALSQGLKSSWRLLTPNGRIAVISFHSLEDRIVKQYFNELKNKGEGALIVKRPIVAGEAEVSSNPRARSAKLRIIKKI